MANSIASSEPVSEINPADPNPSPSPNPSPESDHFDPLQFPPIDLDFLSPDLTIPEGFISDLFEDDFDFTFDDLAFPEPNDAFPGENLSDTTTQHSHDQSSSRVLNSPSRDSGSSDHDSTGCHSVVNGFLNSPSPDSGVVSTSRASSPNSSNDQEINLEESGKGKEGSEPSLKRKKEIEEENTTHVSNTKSSKIRKSASSDVSSPMPDGDDKRKARLMRNRESAQLSRQRKKHYVEELEDKVKSMHSVIADLNNKISYFMAENASLRQQLTVGPGGVYPPPPGMYPPMAPMPYPWIPYPMKPQGSQVPLVPIPKLKPQQPLPAPKVKKSESRKSEGKSSKTKKVASVSFLGLLFFVLLFGGLVPLIDVNYGARRQMVSNGFGSTDDSLDGKFLTVNGSQHRVGVGLHGGGRSSIRECGANGKHCKRVLHERVDSKANHTKPGTQSTPGSDGFANMGNSSEPLAASLYVPRNDKLVKIDGNLIINSVLASERAVASGVKNNKHTAESTEKTQTGLAIARNLAPALAIPNGGRNAERHPHAYRISNEPQKALNSGSGESHKEKSKSSDGSLQKWFREGLEGPIFSSGMCTEVFQFDTSPASANPGAIVPATSSTGSRTSHRPDSAHLSRRNRRILRHLPITLGDLEFNSTKDQAGRPSQDGNFHGNDTVSSMVVSVLVDPRENGDGEGEGVLPQKSMSRIFVVVLMDSVKYVTYSCILPLKGSAPHLVTT